MSQTSCSQEGAIARAVRAGEWNGTLEAHLRECAICRGVQDAARWMQALAPAARLSAQSQNDLPAGMELEWNRRRNRRSPGLGAIRRMAGALG